MTNINLYVFALISTMKPMGEAALVTGAGGLKSWITPYFGEQKKAFGIRPEILYMTVPVAWVLNFAGTGFSLGLMG